jgi:hypothetical protein
MAGIVNEVVERLLARGPRFSSTELAREAGISRQAVHKQLKKALAAGQLVVTGRARAARYERPAAALRTRLEVASAGSLYRLSARLLLMDVEAGEVTLDFTGVAELGDEFLDELFLVWAPAHPRVTLKVAHLPARLAPAFFDFAKRARGAVAPVAAAS